MKILSKLLISNDICPFIEVVGLRATAEPDYNSKTIYLKCEEGQNSWGVAFVMKEGYLAERPSNIGLSLGSKNGYTFWVSSVNRPATLDYNFNVKKGDKVTHTYRIVYID